MKYGSPRWSESHRRRNRVTIKLVGEGLENGEGRDESVCFYNFIEKSSRGIGILIIE